MLRMGDCRRSGVNLDPHFTLFQDTNGRSRMQCNYCKSHLGARKAFLKHLNKFHAEISKCLWQTPLTDQDRELLREFAIFGRPNQIQIHSRGNHLIWLDENRLLVNLTFGRLNCNVLTRPKPTLGRKRGGQTIMISDIKIPKHLRIKKSDYRKLKHPFEMGHLVPIRSFGTSKDTAKKLKRFSVTAPIHWKLNSDSRKIEKSARQLTLAYPVWIMTGTTGVMKRIPASNLRIPRYWWYLVIIYEAETDKFIYDAFWFENACPTGNLQDYRVDICELRVLTGLDICRNVLHCMFQDDLVRKAELLQEKVAKNVVRLRADIASAKSEIAKMRRVLRRLSTRNRFFTLPIRSLSLLRRTTP